MRPDLIFVTPKEGIVVRDPATMEPLPEEGKEVLNLSFWQRRAKDGDVVIALPKQKMKAKIKEAKKPETKIKSVKGKKGD